MCPGLASQLLQHFPRFSFGLLRESPYRTAGSVAMLLHVMSSVSSTVLFQLRFTTGLKTACEVGVCEEHSFLEALVLQHHDADVNQAGRTEHCCRIAGRWRTCNTQLQLHLCNTTRLCPIKAWTKRTHHRCRDHRWIPRPLPPATARTLGGKLGLQGNGHVLPAALRHHEQAACLRA